MHDFNTLFHHPALGYIVQFTRSKKLQLGYQIIKIEFFEDEFARFLQYLRCLETEYAGTDNIRLKHIVVYTPDPSLEIVLSYRELLQLLEMAETADSERTALALIAGFCAQ